MSWTDGREAGARSAGGAEHIALAMTKHLLSQPVRKGLGFQHAHDQG
jgi:hypothetical protein